MKLGDIANSEALPFGKPLDGVRVLTAEQMQALPFATQLLSRLGAEVIKVEHPVRGESGRGSDPSVADPDGRRVGATYLRNNFNKSSVGLDLQSEECGIPALAVQDEGKRLRHLAAELPDLALVLPPAGGVSREVRPGIDPVVIEQFHLRSMAIVHLQTSGRTESEPGTGFE